MILKNTNLIQESELDSWTLFLKAMRASMTRERYQTRVSKFSIFIGLLRRLERNARTFSKKWQKRDAKLDFFAILKLVYFQRERIEKRKDVEPVTNYTVTNYTISIKLFCKMGESRST